LVPHDSFMGRYLAYMQRQETALAFDWWSGLWALACACGRHTYVARPRAPIFLNMYTILIGESGVARKTTSVATASKLVRQLCDDDPVMGFIDAKVTGEKLDDLLHQRTEAYGSAQMCAAVPELAVFLGTERYISNMPTLLTDLYDCPSHRHGGGTIARGECVQRDVWLSFLSASTPIWLLKTVNPNVVEGGFTSRCLFIVSNTPKHRIPWPDGSDTEHDYAWLLADLRAVHERVMDSQPIGLTDGGMSTFTKWYKTRGRSLDPFKQSFEAREDAHVLRVSALLSINDGTWRIDHHHVSRSIKLIADVKQASSAIFENTEQRTKFAYSLDKIRAILVSRGMDPVPRSDLYRRARHTLSHEEFMSLVEVLHEIGAVQRFSHQPDRGRPAEYYRGTNLLLARGLGEQVLDKFT